MLLNKTNALYVCQVSKSSEQDQVEGLWWCPGVETTMK